MLVASITLTSCYGSVTVVQSTLRENEFVTRYDTNQGEFIEVFKGGLDATHDFILGALIIKDDSDDAGKVLGMLTQLEVM